MEPDANRLLLGYFIKFPVITTHLDYDHFGNCLGATVEL